MHRQEAPEGVLSREREERKKKRSAEQVADHRRREILAPRLRASGESGGKSIPRIFAPQLQLFTFFPLLALHTVGTKYAVAFATDGEAPLRTWSKRLRLGQA